MQCYIVFYQKAQIYETFNEQIIQDKLNNRPRKPLSCKIPAKELYQFVTLRT